MKLESITLKEFREAVAKKPKRRAAKTWTIGNAGRNGMDSTVQADLHYLDDKLAVFTDGSVVFDDIDITMKRSVYAVLWKLTSRPNKFFSSTALERAISQEQYNSRTVDVRVHYLRTSLGDSNKRVIMNAPHRGYLYVPQGKVVVAEDTSGLYPNYKDNSLELFSDGIANISGNAMCLTRKEYLLLCHLLANPGNPVKKSKVLEWLYGNDISELVSPEASLRKLICTLNEKIGYDGNLAVVSRRVGNECVFLPQGKPSINKYAGT